MTTEQFAQQLEAKNPAAIMMVVVGFLILICSVIAMVVSVVLAVCYFRYNRRENSAGLTGRDAARKILDDNGLQQIKVSATGSILFGNSYSHFFRKVRLRRRTWKKTSLVSMAMAAQKSALAVLDKERDPDMQRRIRMTVMTNFGPLMFIPLMVVGAFIDYMLTSNFGIYTIAATAVGLLFYVYSFLLSLSTLKTEKKAEEKAVQILRAEGLANEEELADMKKLFHIYNIEYVNNMVLSMLELVYNVLRVFMILEGNGKTSSKK